MTDEQLATYLGIPSDHPKKAAVIAGLSSAKRALYERMATLEIELGLWQAGLGPKPNALITASKGDRQ